MRLIGRVVKLLDIDVRRDTPCDCLILVRRYGATERQDKTQAGLFGCVLVRTVDHGCRALEGEHHKIPEVRLRKVRIERQELTTCDRLRCTSAALENAADEAAHILDAALLGLGELLVFGDGLARPLRLAKTADKVRPHDFFVLPVLIHPGASDGNRKASVVQKRGDGVCLVAHEDPPILTPPMQSLRPLSPATVRLYPRSGRMRCRPDPPMR